MSKHSTRRRAKLSPLTVLGEMLLLGGLVVMGYIFWQPWYTTNVVADRQAQLSAQTVASWAEAESDASASEWDGVIPVAARVAEPEVFGVMYVPAFGHGFMNQIAEGTSRTEVLNLSEKGIGHYVSTQMPGETGNFAVAAHRSGPRTTPFKEAMNLRLGDALYVQTPEGWYTYIFRSQEYVLPDEGDVLNPFPRIDGVPGTDQILTLTTCHPKDFGADERTIIYAVFDSFQPSSEGPPEALLSVNPALGGG